MIDSKKSVFKAGAYVYIEGDEDSDEIFIVEKGEVELKSVNEQVKKYKSIINAGEVFGFTSSLCRRPRMESALARRDSAVIAIKREKFINLVQSNPPVAFKIINYFAEELRMYNEMMFHLEAEEQSIEMPSDELRFFDMGEYYYAKGDLSYAFYIFSKFVRQYPRSENASRAAEILSSIEKTENRLVAEPIAKGVYKVYSDRQMIFSEYETGEELYIIKEGKVKIVKISNKQEILLSVLKEGDIFGELAIVSNKPRNATAIAWGVTTLLPIRKETLTTVLEKSPGIINRIFMAISQRIWFTFIRLEARLYLKPLTRIYAFLENKLLEERISLKDTQPATFTFGIDELFRMTGLPPSPSASVVDALLEDSNLNFNFGQTVVENPSVLSTKAKFFRSRDHLAGTDEEEESRREERLAPFAAKKPEPKPEKTEEVTPSAEAPAAEPAAAKPKAPEKPAAKTAVGLDPDELRIPSEEIEF